MRWPAVLLLLLVVALQYPLWLGRDSWLRVWESEKELQARSEKNLALEARNAPLKSEVDDLQRGTAAIEERARYDLGMVKPGEVFVHTPRRAPQAAPTPEPAAQPAATP
ncbi:MAG: cell division protein FtsB [Azoarcus sp.]|jgi:cell division protein FtsB|nr:cell division protein FtsB [Azoarcus sp.]